jgi:hypothetical protein
MAHDGRSGLRRQLGYISPGLIGAIAGRRRGGGGGGGGGGEGGGGGSDPYFANVSSLLHFDDGDSSTSILDHSPGSPSRLWTARGNAQIDTAQSMFGGSSCVFDGTGDYVDTPASPDFNLGTDDFTIEWWIRFSSVAGTQRIAGQSDNTGASTSASVSILKTAPADPKFQALSLSGGSVIGSCTGTTTVVVDTWYHVAYQREVTLFTLFVDGVAEATATSASSINSSVNKFSIGRLGELNSDFVAGWVDDFRFTKGVARYVGSPTNFTRPSAAFPNS